jgi:sulfur carrier protein ThiS
VSGVATVEIVGMLRDYVKESADQTQPIEGSTVRELIRSLGLPEDLVAFVMVGGQQRPKTYTIQPGDTVKLISFVGGG